MRRRCRLLGYRNVRGVREDVRGVRRTRIEYGPDVVTMTDQRTSEGAAVRDRIDRFLAEHGLAAPTVRVVPLTGDASDRRYFRIISADRPSTVLALHAGPINFAALPFANVARLLQQ